MTKKIVFVGGGNMGEALISGLVRSGHWKPSHIIVCDIRHDQLAKLQLRYKVQASADNRWAVREADIILLAVKPQNMKHVLEEVGPVIRQKQRGYWEDTSASSQTRAELWAGVPTVRQAGRREKRLPSGTQALRGGSSLCIQFKLASTS